MFQREVEIQELIGKGHERTYICETLAEKYGVSPRTIQDQYYNVVNSLGDSVVEGRSELRSKLMARNDYIYKEAVRKKNLKTALDANAAQAKLAGLYDKAEDKPAERPTIKLVKQDFSKPEAVVPDKASNDE